MVKSIVTRFDSCNKTQSILFIHTTNRFNPVNNLMVTCFSSTSSKKLQLAFHPSPFKQLPIFPVFTMPSSELQPPPSSHPSLCHHCHHHPPADTDGTCLVTLAFHCRTWLPWGCKVILVQNLIVSYDDICINHITKRLTQYVNNRMENPKKNTWHNFLIPKCSILITRIHVSKLIPFPALEARFVTSTSRLAIPWNIEEIISHDIHPMEIIVLLKEKKNPELRRLKWNVWLTMADQCSETIESSEITLKQLCQAANSNVKWEMQVP